MARSHLRYAEGKRAFPRDMAISTPDTPRANIPLLSRPYSQALRPNSMKLFSFPRISVRETMAST